MARKTKGETVVATDQTEEQQLADQEQAEEQGAQPAGGAPDIRIELPGSEKPISEMSPQEILALLERRRSELSQLTSVAKDKGIKVPTKGKPKVADADRLMSFFNRLGYAAGMRWWGQSRLNANAERISPVLEQLGDSWNPERQGEAIEQMSRGFQEARIQTSFPSTSMPDKKSAGDVGLSLVWAELITRLRTEGAPDFVQALLESELGAENTESAEDEDQ